MPRAPKYEEPTLLLDRAQSLYWRSGWAGPSIRDLEATLDLKAPSIYRRFGSKAALEIAVLDHYIERIVARRIDRYLSTEGDPRRNLESFLLSAVEERSDAHPSGCLLVMGTAAAAGQPHLGAGVVRGLSLIEVGLSREVGRLAGRGQLALGDQTVVVDRILVAFVGLMALARAGEPATNLQRRAASVLRDLT